MFLNESHSTYFYILNRDINIDINAIKYLNTLSSVTVLNHSLRLNTRESNIHVTYNYYILLKCNRKYVVVRGNVIKSHWFVLYRVSVI